MKSLPRSDGIRSLAGVTLFAGMIFLVGGGTELRADARDLSRVREEIYRDLTDRQAALQATLDQLDQTSLALERWLAAQGLAPADLAARLAEVEAERVRWAAIVADTEPRVREQLERLEADPGMLETVLASHALELAQLRQEITALHRTLRETPRDVGMQTSVSLAGLSARPFLLTGDRIAPFDEPYFSSREVRVRRADRTLEMRLRFDRVADAGPVRAAIEPGGVVAEMVDDPEFDPEETYVTLWVCADAIDGYRMVSEYLKSRGVRYTWTTDVDEPWVASPESAEYEAWGYESR